MSGPDSIDSRGGAEETANAGRGEWGTNKKQHRERGDGRTNNQMEGREVGRVYMREYG